jgi:hypothetical protein
MSRNALFHLIEARGVLICTSSVELVAGVLVSAIVRACAGINPTCVTSRTTAPTLAAAVAAASACSASLAACLAAAAFIRFANRGGTKPFACARNIG